MPLNFLGTHTGDLSHWKGDHAAHELVPVLRAVQVLISRSPPSPGADRVATPQPIQAPRTITAPLGGYLLMRIPGGSFQIGSPQSEKGRHHDENPQHKVKLADFCLGRYPVTNEEYGRYLAANPGTPEPQHWGDRKYNQPKQPVVGVSWEEARAYCEWAGLVLPTEAQWEYACRAGTTTAYWSGDSEEDLERVGWYVKNSDGRLHPVGEKPANPFGLHDMHGNVWEWCRDLFGSYDRDPVRGRDGMRNVKGSGIRVSRGGCFGDGSGCARSAYRVNAPPTYRSLALGFRAGQGITDRRRRSEEDGQR